MFLDWVSNTFSFTLFFPVITLVLLLYFFLYYLKASRPLAGTTEWVDAEISKVDLTFFNSRHPLEKRDIMPILVIAAVFSFLALFKLGDTTAPQSFTQFAANYDQVFIELDEPEDIGSIMFFTGLWTGYYTLEFSQDGSTWLEQGAQQSDSEPYDIAPAMLQRFSDVFKWRFAELRDDNPYISYIRVTASRVPIELGELALFRTNGELISGLSSNTPQLFDEQHLVPGRPSYMNSMYFDEVYHGRTALEYLRGINPYENTHPPLGKAIISASILTFGMTPFGWRFAGAIFGVLMLLVLYVFIKNIFGKTVVAVCGTLLLGFDFMRFVQTRIATIDTYGVFFILLAYFFMYWYITTDPDAPLRKSLLPLALSGVAFGFGCASKWIVVYAGFGLAVIYLIRLVHLSKYYRRNDLGCFKSYLTKTLLFSVLFFVVVPAIIYSLSYIPFAYARGLDFSGGAVWTAEFYRQFFDIIWSNQVLMFNYHSGLVATHPFSSVWWQWILNLRPILYYNSHFDGVRSSFAAFGNPVIWWGGFVAMVIMGLRVVRHRDGIALFIVIGYLSQLLPWIPISRIVFIYHYFPSTLFIVLALAHIFNTIFENRRKGYQLAVYGYTAGAGVLFIKFYPALTGVAAPRWYFTNILRWIPGLWPF